MADENGVPLSETRTGDNYHLGRTPEFNVGYAEAMRRAAAMVGGDRAAELIALAETAERVEQKQTAEGYREAYARAIVDWTDEKIDEMMARYTAGEFRVGSLDEVIAELEAKNREAKDRTAP